MAAPSKPSIILHPGLPKCATSYLQRLFVIKNHALPQALGVSALGKGFVPMNGFPPITELLYAYEECLRSFHEQHFPDGRYFLSSEALVARPDFIREIAASIHISRLVVTVRFSPLQALSNFKFSGWISADLKCTLADPKTGPFHALDRHRQKLVQFSSFGDVLACPVESGPDSIGLAERFCLACFGRAPSFLAEPEFGNSAFANQSVGLAFAEVLRAAIVEKGAVFSGPDRARIVKLVQNSRLPAGLQELLPAGGAVGELTRMFDHLGEYDALLRDFGVSIEHRQAAVAVAERQVRAFLNNPVATAEQMQALESRARALIDDWLRAGAA